MEKIRPILAGLLAIFILSVGARSTKQRTVKPGDCVYDGKFDFRFLGDGPVWSEELDRITEVL